MSLAGFLPPDLTVLNGNGHNVSRPSRRGWLMLGAEGFCHDVSDSFAEMLGRPKSSFMVRNWIRLIYVEDRAAIRGIVDLLQQERLPPPVTVRWLRVDDTVVWLKIRFLRQRGPKVRELGEELFIANVIRVRPEAA